MHDNIYTITMPEDKIKLTAALINLVIKQNQNKQDTETFVKYCSLMGKLTKEGGMSRDDLLSYTKDLEKRFGSNRKLRMK